MTMRSRRSSIVVTSRRLPLPRKASDTLDVFAATLAEVRNAYLADARPWVIGYSGGKDSTTALQLVWQALAGMPAEKRSKHVYVVAGDTRVETPVIIDYLDDALRSINDR